ncbi:MgtC/SapB family protein [Blautia sp. MSJ-19]|uniref:MgtC/SapB family protein n=1 Tax=Blautia sp. MSJ-19 TaxID=2841517 RepID=UPI001C0EB394|nr:MgtC/SapB family protein [Blautia sp. MSJ-19]MBU5482262.1 MgtC/SapB family protein [Blautia sp. MSJ-19]
MLKMLDPLRAITLYSVAFRMVLACICGGIIGIEREYKHRPAGFRTHILICLGASMTTLTSQYLSLIMNYTTDISRLGAQVISGIGFIGAGTIIVTKRQRVKGLTTASGLWTVAIVGLAVGAGFYEGAVYASVGIFLAESIFTKVGHYVQKYSPEINVYMEYAERRCLKPVLQVYRANNVKVLDIEVAKASENGENGFYAMFALRINKGCSEQLLEKMLMDIEGVNLVEKL